MEKRGDSQKSSGGKRLVEGAKIPLPRPTIGKVHKGTISFKGGKPSPK